MKKFEEIKKRIQKLRELINKWNHLYYVENNPEVSDQVYDSHYKELLELEKKYPNLLEKNSPTQNVGFLKLSNLSKIKHKTKMLSLSNAFSFQDLYNFDKRIKKITNGNHKYFCEYKIDGLSISLVFKNNKFNYAVTRGNGIIGENVTKNILQIDCISNIIYKNFFIKNFELRGEVFITKNNFNDLNERILKKQKKELKDNIKNKLKKIFLNVVFNKKEFDLNENIFLKFKTNIEEELNSFNKEKEFIFYIFGSKDTLNIILKNYQKINIDIISTFNEYLIIKTKILFSRLKFINPRNAASGSLRQLDVNVTKKRNLSVIFYDLIQDEISINTQEEIIQKIKELGFPVEKRSKKVSNINKVIEFIENSKKIKEFETDGIVIKTNEKKYYKQIGLTTKHPNYNIAYKFPEQKVETKLLDIFPTVGRTGKITYNAVLQQVFLEGTIVKAATLHNAKYIENLDIRINDVVIIKKAGNIIPKVIGFNKEFRNKNCILWKRNEKCPSCFSFLKIFDNEIDQYCTNQECYEKNIQSLIHFASRDVMNIIGVNESIIRNFWDLKLLKKTIDFYKLINKKEYLINLIKEKKLVNWGNKSIDNLINSIKKSKLNSWNKLLFGLNIRYVGDKVSKLLANHFGTIENLIQAKYEEIEKILGIGPSVAKSIINFFSNVQNIEILNKFKSFDLNFDKILLKKKDGFFKNKKICITGTFNISRNEIIEKLEKQDAKFVNSISSLTDYLFVGKNPGSKLEKAQKLKIKILKENQILNLLK